MADIPVSYVYTDGNVLVPASHGENIYSVTGNNGIYSEPNGGLFADNLVAGFTAGSEHVGPEEAVLGRQDGYTGDNDYVNGAVGSDGSTSFHPVAGCALRVNLPFAMDAVFWMWSYYISVWRPLLDDGEGSTLTGALRTYLDGAFIGHTQRLVWPTGHLRTVDDGLFSSEGVTARFADQCHLQLTASAGFHELYLALTMQEGNFSDVISRTVGGSSLAVTHHIGARMSFGVRNARCIAWL